MGRKINKQRLLISLQVVLIIISLIVSVIIIYDHYKINYNSGKWVSHKHCNGPEDPKLRKEYEKAKNGIDQLILALALDQSKRTKKYFEQDAVSRPGWFYFKKYWWILLLILIIPIMTAIFTAKSIVIWIPEFIVRYFNWIAPRK